MCGIVGIRHLDGSPVDEPLLREMARRLIHRGPDEEGYWHSGPIGFGHRRLSIINPEGSHQPMSIGGVHLCFNGEIFNYEAIRSELIAEGEGFRTRGDTEVLLNTFRKYGPDGIKNLDGQFAFAVYDEQSEDLWLFRDRIGILPLYYYFDGKTLVFASEIKALLPALPQGPRVDLESVGEYLGFVSVPAPNTLFEGVKKLDPGTYLRLDKNGALHQETYWRLPNAPASSEISPADALPRVDAALKAAVCSRLVADVPVGAYLSGGIDSSLIVALIHELSGGARVETFSAGFDDPRFDERPYATEVAKQFNTHHHEEVIQPSDFLDLWPKLTWHRDAPISQPADVAIFRLATLARQSVRVLLSGEGADELFAGYPKYRFARWASLSGLVPPLLRKPLFQLSEQILPSRLSRLRTMLRAMGEPSEADRFQAWFAPFTSDERGRLCRERQRDGYREICERARGDAVQRMLYTDCHIWLVDNLLERGDRMSMAASVESRPPFLDHHLVELAFSLPSNLKIRNGVTKWIIKEIARKHLPAHIVDRKKAGFRVPLDQWFRSGLREISHDLLDSSDSFVSGCLDRSMVQELMRSHESGRRDESMRIWTLLGLEIWYKTFFEEGAISRQARQA